jgi:hypothetical protein
MAWLQRRTPKLFLSYKRLDSGPVAMQIFDHFTHLGYDTFLDEASVEPGADFQRELMWWLNDADLLIVLASPNYPRSKWCMEELTFCQQRFIGIGMIEWPRAIYRQRGRVSFPGVPAHARRPLIIEAATPDQIMSLTCLDFASRSRVGPCPGTSSLPSRHLTRSALDRVTAFCARQRTVGIRQRLDNLIPLARRLLPGAQAQAGASGPGDLVFRDSAGSSFARVLPFRPEPDTIRQACSDGAHYGLSGCFYAENDPYDSRAMALRWLTNCPRPSVPHLSNCWVWACWGDTLL